MASTLAGLSAFPVRMLNRAASAKARRAICRARSSRPPRIRASVRSDSTHAATASADPYVTDPRQFAELVSADIRKWAKVVQATGVTLD